MTGLVAGGPADDAGLGCGDAVTAVGRAAVADSTDLQEAVDAQSPGAEVTLTVTAAGGEARTVDVTLGDRPASAAQAAPACGR